MPGGPVRQALALQREVEATWKAHRLHCLRCSGGKIAQAACAEGFALEADRQDAAQVLAMRREQERAAAMAQLPLFTDEELAAGARRVVAETAPEPTEEQLRELARIWPPRGDER